MSTVKAFIVGFAGGVLGGYIVCEVFWREVRATLREALEEMGLKRGRGVRPRGRTRGARAAARQALRR